MAGRSTSHSEQWWASGAKPGVRRCRAMKKDGAQCRRVAEAGSVVCGHHGGLAPQVQHRAKERMAIVSDAIVEQLLSWLWDPNVPLALKIKIATDILDRAGVDRSAKITVGVDPVESLFANLLERDDALERDREPLALPTVDVLQDEDGAYFGAVVGDPDYWDGPPVAPGPDIIEGEVIDDTPAFIRGVLKDGRTS